jgi:putative acetyltransferase
VGSNPATPTMDVQLRSATASDAPAVRDVVVRAFTDQPEVADLVDAIRASREYVPDLALVATVDGAAAGFVMASYTYLVDGGARHRILSLSPLAVTPLHERRGLGSALVEQVVQRAADRGEPMVVLEGSPAFYGRLGFEHSVPHGISIDLPDWAPAQAAQVRLLPSYDPAVRGALEYPAAFAVVSAH